MRVYAKGQLQGLIRGLPFKQAVFAIWLGEKPADKSLKAGMLGITHPIQFPFRDGRLRAAIFYCSNVSSVIHFPPVE